MASPPAEWISAVRLAAPPGQSSSRRRKFASDRANIARYSASERELTSTAPIPLSGTAGAGRPEGSWSGTLTEPSLTRPVA